jgi:predicted membrane GTPase involved in stress response
LATAELYGPTHADHGGVRHERLHVLSALLLVVLAVDGMIERTSLMV